MSIVKNILVAPIGLAEAYAYIGHTPGPSGIYDLYSLLTSERINKWAKHKPIRFDKWAELTEAERAGSVQDHMNGIYYGVHLAGAGGNLAAMHSVTFDYYPLRPGTDIGRLSDLDGYDKNARPNPVGELPETVYIDLVQPHGICTLTYSQSNTTGINVSEAIATLNPGTDIGDFYPCILVTIDGQSYVRALWNLHYGLDQILEPSQQTVGFTTFRSGGAWWSQWAIILSGLPGLADGKQITATAFFMRRIAASETLVGSDFRQWVKVDGTLSTNTGFACPEAVARTILLKNYYSKGLTLTGGSWAKKTGSATIIRLLLFTEWVEPRDGVTYTLRGTLVSLSDSTRTYSIVKSYPYPPETGGLLIEDAIEIDTSILNISTSAAFRLDWRIYPSVNPDTPCNSGSTTIQFSGL